MIYIVAGNDNKKKSEYINKICKNTNLIDIPEGQITKELILNYANGVSLFGEKNSIKVFNVLKSDTLDISTEELESIKNSNNIFIFNEDKILAADEKKYKKFAEEIVKFEEKKTAKAPQLNTFAIADAYGARDKVKAWILYREAIDQGTEPEPISGMLFWKIKNMLLTGSKVFTSESLKHQSSELMSLYHLAHRGERDFTVGLEQFILTSLSK